MKHADGIENVVNQGLKSTKAAEAASIISSEVKAPTRRYVACVDVRIRQATIASDTPDNTAASRT